MIPPPVGWPKAVPAKGGDASPLPVSHTDDGEVRQVGG